MLYSKQNSKDRIIDDNLTHWCKVAEKVKENIIAAQERQKRNMTESTTILRYLIMKLLHWFRAEVIMLINWALFFWEILIILPIMLTDFTYYPQNHAYFKIHDLKNDY